MAGAGVIGGTHDNMGPGMGPVVDHTYLATPRTGYDLERTKNQPSSLAPTPVSKGAFRTVCGFSHMAHDDPIVWPNQPGRTHLHTFFGNTGVNAYSTAESIATTGNSTCRGGILNRTAYWAPSMINTETGAPLIPLDAGVYYKTPIGPGTVPANMGDFPDGLRMVAGNAKATAPQSGSNVRWQCISTNGTYPTYTTIDPNTGTAWPKFTVVDTQPGPAIPDCPIGSTLIQEIFFPSCWDGWNLDSADHKSHMAYHNYTNGCPATHPVSLPVITLNVHYLVTMPTSQWRLSSDMYPDTDPAGYSSHGDWFNGWHRPTQLMWNQKCNRESKDCHSDVLGNGLMLY